MSGYRPLMSRSDAANRLSTVTDWNSNAATYAYDDANRMTTATLPNGVGSSYAYDNANRLTGISHVKGATTLASVSYTADAVGNRSEESDMGSPPPLPGGLPPVWAVP